jgi:hypothetical protein
VDELSLGAKIVKLRFARRAVWIRVLACGYWLALFAGCDQKALLERMTPPADDKLARQFLSHLIAGRAQEAAAMLAPEIQNDENRKGIEQLVALFNGDTAKSITVVGVHWTKSLAGGRANQTQLTYQVELAGGWFAGLVVVTGDDAARRILTARFNPTPDSLEKMNAFSFAGKGGAHYLMLALLLLVPLFCLIALVLCLRARIRRKWLWCLFIVIGVFQWQMNWTTGETAFRPLYFQLLGAGAIKAGPYAAWILSVAFPLGAAIFLLKRRTLIARAAPPPELPPPVLPPPMATP